MLHSVARVRLLLVHIKVGVERGSVTMLAAKWSTAVAPVVPEMNLR